MKQYHATAFFIIPALILLASPQPSRADQQWHYQAAAQVSQPGLIETVLPAGVFFGTDNAVTTSQAHRRVGPSHQLKNNHKDEDITYQCPLAVTIQKTISWGLYGNYVGTSLLIIGHTMGDRRAKGCRVLSRGVGR